MDVDTCRAEISYSKTIPAKFPFGQRSFLKATFFDDEKQLLVSKSILRDDMPAVRRNSAYLPCPSCQHVCDCCNLSTGLGSAERTAREGVGFGPHVLSPHIGGAAIYQVYAAVLA